MADQGVEQLLSPVLRLQRVKAARHYLMRGVPDVGCRSGAMADWVLPDQYFGRDVDGLSMKRDSKVHS
jgi:hypothetical protein